MRNDGLLGCCPVVGVRIMWLCDPESDVGVLQNESMYPFEDKIVVLYHDLSQKKNAIFTSQNYRNLKDFTETAHNYLIVLM